jgi:hypothetical protein
MSKLKRLQPAIQHLQNTLSKVSACWLIGGSTGLLLQGVPLQAEPRDLDLYTDRVHIRALHDALRSHATDIPHDSETGMYRSNLSHYIISGVIVELVGSLEVDRGSAHYEVETTEVMNGFAPDIEFAGMRVRVMPLVHELLFNVLRERPDRYIPIAEVIRSNPDDHRGVWRTLFDRNRIGEPYIGIIRSLLPELVQGG